MCMDVCVCLHKDLLKEFIVRILKQTNVTVPFLQVYFIYLFFPTVVLQLL